MMALEGGSFGFQIGGQARDFVLLVTNGGGVRGILAGNSSWEEMLLLPQDQ